ncbi:hypothetical protein [Actinomadura sp. 9N407]|uniref:hypothetical protein n=1 Tax=Actinomadura sp. 9N407 TaxID=3375154 RepID=UPI0037B78DD3
MSIVYDGTDARGVLIRHPREDPPPRRAPSPLAPTVARTLASALIIAAGLFYAVVAIQGVAGLLGPPPEMVTTAGESGAATPATGDPARTVLNERSAATEELDLLLRPLALTGAALAGLLLLWSGARGLYFRNDQRRWRSRQVTALAGCGAGVLAFALGIGAAGGSAAAYADAAWNGLEPIRPTAVLALLVATIALLIPVPRQARSQNGQHGQNGRSPARSSPAHHRRRVS